MAKKPARRTKKAPRDLKARKDVKGGLLPTRMQIRGPIGITNT
jgi:hypothetical protein